MASIAHGGMNPRAEKPKPPKKELEHIRLQATNDGVVEAEHHHTAFEHPPEKYADFEGMKEKHPVIKGHLFHHLAKQLGIPHFVIEEKEESEKETAGKEHEPSEEEELEEGEE